MRKKSTLVAVLVLVVMISLVVFAACDDKLVTYTVTLDSGQDEVTTINDLQVLTAAPEAPVNDGYRFEGWYLDAEFTQQPAYPLTLTENITLYAKWTKLYTVGFEVNGGSALESLVTDVIETSPRTYRDGFVFEGWFTSPRLTGSPVTFPYKPSKDVTLYAKWTEDAGSAEFSQTTTYVNAKTAVNKIKGYFETMSGIALDFDSLLTTTAGTARVQMQANNVSGESLEMMFKITMQDESKTSFAVYALDGEVYIEIGSDGDSTYVHLDDFNADYLFAILQQAGVKLDLEELLGNVGGMNIYDMLINLVFSSPAYTSVTRVATGEVISESYLGEIKVNSLVSGIASILKMLNLGDLIGVDIDINSLFSWLNSAIPQVKMYIQVDVEGGTITNMALSVADNADGSAGDELLDWKSTKIGYYNYPIYIDIPSDIAKSSREFSFTNLAFDVDLTLDAPEQGLDVAKLLSVFTNDVPVPENALIIKGEFGFRLSARVDLDLNYENAAVDRNLIALDLYVLGADGNPTSTTPVLGIYYRDGAFYVSLSDLIPDYWKANNIKIEANLDALISDVVKLITNAIDDALGTDFDGAKSLPLSSGNVYEAVLTGEGEDAKAIISPTVSGLIAAVAGVIGLQENVYVDEEGDSIIIEVNQKFFDAINKFMPDNAIILPDGLSNMSLSVNFADYGVKDIVATVNMGDADAPLEATLKAHNFKIGFLEGTMQDLESYIAERTQEGNYTSNLGELINSVLAGVEVNAHGSLTIEQGVYALGKVLKAFGLDTGKDNPLLMIDEGGYALGINLMAGFAIDRQNPENSKLAIELSKTEGGILLGVYGYYENGISTVLLDLSGIKTEYLTLPVYKFEFDFANIVTDLINNIKIDGKTLDEFSLAFDLGGLIGSSSEAESLIMSESDGTAGGTELTNAGAILIGLSADKIVANVTFAALIALLEKMGVDTGISTDALDLSAEVELSAKGVTLDFSGNLPKESKYGADGAALPQEYGKYTLSVEAGTEAYPINVGSTVSLDEAIKRGKAKAAEAEDNLYDVIFGLANSMQASLTVNLSNEKDNIDIASMINNILAKEGQYIGFPITLEFDKNDANLYLDLKWDIHLDNPYYTKIYLELRYEQKKIVSLGIQKNNLYVDLEGLGLFAFNVENSELSSSLLTMLDEKAGALRDMDLGALLTELITGAGGLTEDGESGSATEDTDSANDDTTAILAAILGDITIYNGVIQANIAASTFEIIFKALLGSSLGVNIEVNGGEIDVESGVVRLPVTVNDTLSLTAQLELRPSEDFTVSEFDNGLNAADGEAMARSLLKCLNMDFNLDILNNNIESTPDDSYLRVRIKNVVEGEFKLDGTSDSVGPETLVISLYLIDSEDKFNNTTADVSGNALLHITLDYSDDALGADGTGKNMKITLVPGKFKVSIDLVITTYDVDLASVVGSMLTFQMDIVNMLSGAMQSIIDSLVFTDDGIEMETPTIDTSGSLTGEEEEAAASPFDDLDINELLSGGITISLRSTGTFNINVDFDPYTFNKLIDDLMGGMVFGANSTVNLAELAPDMFGAHYLKYVNWDRLNFKAFWSTLKNELLQIVKTLIQNNVDVVGGIAADALDGPVEGLLDGIVYDIVKSLLPLPVYNEVRAGVNIVDGTLTNIYIEGYDNNEAVVNEDGEVLEYNGSYCVSTEDNIVENNLVYNANQRRNTYKTEINLYNCFSSVGDPDNTVDGSGTAGVINWGNMEFDMTFEPLAYEDDVVTSDYEFIEKYFTGKVAVYQQGTTVMKSTIKFYLYDGESYGEEIVLGSSLGLLDYANNENFETVTLKGKAEVSFPNGESREREFTISALPNLTPALVDTVTLHAYDDVPSSIAVYFANRSMRRVEMSAIKSVEMPTPTIEGGFYDAKVTFRNGKTANFSIEYLNSEITTLGSNGESGVYELDLYAFDDTLDIMAQLPTKLFFSYPDGTYGAIDVESWSVDAEVLQTFAGRNPDDLSGFEFKATAEVGKGNLVQYLELTVRIKGKEVTSLTIDGNKDTVTVNPYDYYLYALSATEGTVFSPWPSTVDANYVYNGNEWSEDVKVRFSTDFDYATLRYDSVGQYEATATLSGSKYFTWSRQVTLDVQSNVIEGVYFDRSLRRNTINIDALAFNNMSAEDKEAQFPTTAWVKFENGYVLALPIRWTDRNGYPLDFATLTFDANNYDLTVYAEIGFGAEIKTTAEDGTELSAEEIAAQQAAKAALEAAFYQRCAMTVKVSGEITYLGEGITIDPFGEGGTAQFPSTLKAGNADISFDLTVKNWDVSGIDFSAKGGEYVAAATVEYNGKNYTLLVPVTVTAKEVEGIAELDGQTFNAVYDETANTVTVEVNGTSYEVVANPTATAAMTVKFVGGTSVSREVTLDFSSVRPSDDTVYYDSSSGTTAEEQGATVFTATAIVKDAAGNEYTVLFKITISIINRIEQPEGPTTEPDEPTTEPENPATEPQDPAAQTDTPSDGENA